MRVTARLSYGLDALVDDGSRSFETARVPARLAPVWRAISQAGIDAAEAMTLSDLPTETPPDLVPDPPTGLGDTMPPIV